MGTGKEAMSHRARENCDDCNEAIQGVANTYGGLTLCDVCFQPWAADKARITKQVERWLAPIEWEPIGDETRLGKPPEWRALSLTVEQAGRLDSPRQWHAPEGVGMVAPRPAPATSVVRLPAPKPGARPVSTVAIRAPDVAPVRVRRAPEVETRLGTVATVPLLPSRPRKPKALIWEPKRRPEEERMDAIVALVQQRGSITVKATADALGGHRTMIREWLDRLTDAGRLERHYPGSWPVWTLPGAECPLTDTQRLVVLVRERGGKATLLQVRKAFGWERRKVYETASACKLLRYDMGVTHLLDGA